MSREMSLPKSRDTSGRRPIAIRICPARVLTGPLPSFGVMMQLKLPSSSRISVTVASQ